MIKGVLLRSIQTFVMFQTIVRITSLIYDNWLWLAHGHFVKLFAWLAVLTGFYPCAAMLCGISNGCIEEPTEKQAPRRNQKCHTCSRFKLRMLWRGLSSGIPLKTVRNWKGHSHSCDSDAVIFQFVIAANAARNNPTYSNYISPFLISHTHGPVSHRVSTKQVLKQYFLGRKVPSK